MLSLIIVCELLCVISMICSCMQRIFHVLHSMWGVDQSLTHHFVGSLQTRCKISIGLRLCCYIHVLHLPVVPFSVTFAVFNLQIFWWMSIKHAEGRIHNIKRALADVDLHKRSILNH